MRSTIREANNRLEEIKYGLNDPLYNLYKGEITKAADTAGVMASGVAKERLTHFASLSERVEPELTNLRNEMKRLIRDGSDGVVDSGAFYGRLTELRRRREVVTAHMDSMRFALDSVEAIDEDPLAYADALFGKTPSLQPSFSF